MEGIMPARSIVYHPISVAGLGWGLSAALVAIFVMCLLAALFIPIRAAHGWVALLSTSPIDSARVWVEGILYSAIAGWITAVIISLVYNRVAAR
jgi:hypothetical protein